ncbi:MAG: acylphosphatase [Planctomycetota bacterium]|jgi:acylphosphatase
MLLVRFHASKTKMNQIGKHITFIGRVQGVGFRYTSYNIARRYQLTGYVKNLADGTVEMMAHGPVDDISACMSDIEEYFGNYIRDTKIQEVPFNSQYTDFKITF